jgi:hypothetical protein
VLGEEHVLRDLYILNLVEVFGREKTTAEPVAESVRSASHRVSDATEAGREPDMPLDILTKLVREAPLPSLAVAFMLGVLVARRR